MAINEYDSPMGVTPMQTYVSQHVDLPFQELQYALANRQKQYDENEIKHEQLQDLVAQVQAQQKDKALRNKLVDEYNNRLVQSIDAVEGDYSRVGKDIKKAARDFKIDMSQGRLGAIQSSYLATQAYHKSLDELVKDEKIDVKTANELKAVSQKRYAGVQEQIQAHGQYNQYSGIEAAHRVDIDQLLEEAAKGYMADTFGSENLMPTPDGKYWVKEGNKTRQVHFDEIAKGLSGVVGRNDMLKAYMNQQAMLKEELDPTFNRADYFTKTINGAITRAANKYSFIEKESTIDIDADAYAQIGYKYNLENPYEEITTSSELVQVPNPLGLTENDNNNTINQSKKIAYDSVMGLLENNARASNDPADLALIDEFKKDPVTFSRNLQNGTIKLNSVDPALHKKRMLMLEGQLNTIAMAEQRNRDAEQYAVTELLKQPGGKQIVEAVRQQKLSNTELANNYKKQYGNNVKTQVGEEKIEIPIDALIRGNANGWTTFLSNTGAQSVTMGAPSYANTNTQTAVLTATAPNGKTYRIEGGEALGIAATARRNETVGYAKYNELKKQYYEDKTGYSSTTGTVSTGFPVYTYNREGKKVLDEKASDANTKQINRFFIDPTSKTLTPTALRLNSFTAGHDPAPVFQQIKNVFGEDVDMSRVTSNAVLKSNIASLNGLNYLYMDVIYSPKEGEAKRMSITIPQTELTSPSLDAIFNSPEQRAYSQYTTAKANNFSTYKPYQDKDIVFDFQDPNKEAVYVGGKAYSVDEYATFQKYAYEKGETTNPMQARIPTEPEKNKNATFTSRQDFLAAVMSKPNTFAKDKPITYISENGNVERVGWEAIEKMINYYKKPE